MSAATAYDSRYYVTITSDSGLSVQVLMDEDSPALVGGYGGWEVIDRPKRVGMTRFKGKDPVRQDLAIRFEGVADETSQESDITTLERMAEMPAAGVQPPTVTLDGFALRKDLTYVIENIEFDKQNAVWAIQGGVQVRIRQAAVLHLLQFVDDDIIITAPTPAVANSGGKKDPSTKTVNPPGETVKQVSQDVYGDPSKYMLILDANRFLDPDPTAIIPAGTTLAIPGKNSFVVP